MPQSLSKLYVHIIFGTKNRQALISGKVEEHLYAYIGSTLNTNESQPLKIGGKPDHVHILGLLSKNLSLSKLVEEVKKRNSKWIKTQGDEFESFAWQSGYDAFSVSQSQVESVSKYIAKQKEHHRKITFEEEFRDFLKKYQVPYDERYVWD